MRVFLTGAAGFIGAALVNKLLHNKLEVFGVDNINDYYTKKLKFDRLENILKNLNPSQKGSWTFENCDIKDRKKIIENVKNFNPDVVINLAAQAGVRNSIDNPHTYIESNLLGFGNILDACKEINVKNFIYASSSSVYGGNLNLPFNEEQNTSHPVSLYAATKRCNEILAHSYSSLYGIPSTGLRFFTVYGPWGRPDMAPMIFTKSIFNKTPIRIFNFGNMQRDFTFIDDVVHGIFKCCFKPATPNQEFNLFQPDPSTSFCPHRIFNIGNAKPVKLTDFIELLEELIGSKAIKKYEKMQEGDVLNTEADFTKLKEWINFEPNTSLKDGLIEFVNWFREYYVN